MEKKKKVMFISSTGGHLNELLQLKPIFNKYDFYIVTEKDKTTEFLKDEYGKKAMYLPYGTRSELLKYIFVYFFLILKTIYLYIKVRPKVIVTTGTHTAGPMCYIRKNIWKQNCLYRNICKCKPKNCNRKIDLSNSRFVYCSMGGNVKTISKSKICWKFILKNYKE